MSYFNHYGGSWKAFGSPGGSSREHSAIDSPKEAKEKEEKDYGQHNRAPKGPCIYSFCLLKTFWIISLLHGDTDYQPSHHSSLFLLLDLCTCKCRLKLVAICFFFLLFLLYLKKEIWDKLHWFVFFLSVYPSGVHQAKDSFRFVGAYREVAKTSFNCYKITVKVELGGTPMCSSCATIGWNAKGQDFPIARLHCTSQVVCSTAYCLRSYFSALWRKTIKPSFLLNLYTILYSHYESKNM